MKIIFATNNPNKLAEIQNALGDDFDLVSLKDIGFEGEIPETGRTLEANALQKATYIYDRYKIPVFADDTGLEVDSLNGLPGVDTAHYSGSRDADANMNKLLSELRFQKDRSAKFKTVIAFITEDDKKLFPGEVQGQIAEAKSGEGGFGYDPVFIPEGESRSFAEMTMDEKKQKNHRVRALKKFTDYLKSNF
ncbi:MAG TPA: RdgB/HAM1 family non-canonical purine NTP pyrophosphatase [Cryomorphaceae bacterium]|nr:RdgB/HAM1 family non-canonical purine NTP pyrophosphatase [Cryomorphaceae bacterium]